MSIRREMLQVARLAPGLLSEGAELVGNFVQGQVHPDGGFRDRAGAPDLYYTVFGLACLQALQAPPPPQTRSWLSGFADGAGLDFVNLCALARCWASLGIPLPESCPAGGMLARIESWRTPEGGYNGAPNSDFGSAYGAFLALGAYQDLGRQPPRAELLAASLLPLLATGGGFGNRPHSQSGITPATAAAESVLRHMGHRPPAGCDRWLLERCHPEGGFFAVPAAPMPDLLSTAVALHALAGMHRDFRFLVEPCLDFIDSLWVNKGGFYGNWGDDRLDCEYTFYGLLALGHLSL